MRRTLWLTTAGWVALSLGGSAAAQPATDTAPVSPAPAAAAPAAGTRTTAYQAAYFAQFAPRNAYDIAQHVPGFQLDLGNNQSSTGVDVRGFAGTAGNVVINGARPSSKAETLDVTLQHIPAQRVVRVEIGPGDLYGSDYSGKSQVLNIVLSEAGGIDANITAGVVRRHQGYIQGNISGSALIRRGASTINLSAGTEQNKQFEEGTDTLVDAVTGDLIEFRRKHNIYLNSDPYVAGSYALEHGADDAYRLNFRWQPSSFDLKQTNRVTPADGAPHDDNLFQNYKHPVIELGGDVTRPLAGGAIKFVALATRRKRDDTDEYLGRSGLLDDGATTDSGFKQIVQAKRNETIGRLSWTRADLLGFSFEAGAEAAYNTLDNHTQFFSYDENGGLVPEELPITDATVKEKRGEVYVNVGRTISPTLRVDGGVNFEFSHLTVSGDATEDRKLKFLKPNLTVDWKPGGGWHSQLSIRRTVAQLDFYDFISNADLSSQRVNGGNATLEPQRTWELHASVDHPLLGDGLFKLDFGRDMVTLLQDRILICDPDDPTVCFDAPGNIGNGTRDFVELTLDAPLSRLWSGLRAKGSLTLQRTRVKDPIDGQERKWSGYFPAWNWNLDIRRDSGKWSYGTSLNDAQRTTAYRTDEFDTNFNGSVYGSAFVEYRPGANTAITFDVDNIFNTSGNRERLLFRPNRATPDQSFIETRERNRHLSFGITLKQSFGGSGGAKVAKAD